jgi:hypothetical protein
MPPRETAGTVLISRIFDQASQVTDGKLGAFSRVRPRYDHSARAKAHRKALLGEVRFWPVSVSTNRLKLRPLLHTARTPTMQSILRSSFVHI